MEKVVPPEFEKTLNRLDWQSTLLQFAYVFLGLIAIIAPIVVASLTEHLEPLYIKLMSTVGALAVAVIGGFRLSTKGNELRRAFLDLKVAILKFKYDESAKVTDLIDAYSVINRRIGNIDGPDVKQHELDAEKVNSSE